MRGALSIAGKHSVRRAHPDKSKSNHGFARMNADKTQNMKAAAKGADIKES